MKKYKLITEISPIQMQIDSEPSDRSWYEILKEVKSAPLDTLKQQPILSSFIEQPISEETFEVLNNICNIEMDKYGERTYICNKIRMKIEEDD